MCIDCKDDILKEYFYLYDSEVPKIKEVICIIFENIIYKKKYLFYVKNKNNLNQ